VADNTLSIRVPVSGAIPEDYEVGGASDIDVLAIMGDWDGSGSGSDFLPVVQFLDAAGQVIAQAVGTVIAAGGSATVTFAPFLRGQTSSPSGGGIQFDTQPQAGQFLYVESDGPAHTSDFYGIELKDTSGNGIGLETNGGVYLVDGSTTLRWTDVSGEGTLFSNNLKVTGNSSLTLNGPNGLLFTGDDFTFTGTLTGGDDFSVNIAGGLILSAGPSSAAQLAIDTAGTVQMNAGGSTVEIDSSGNIFARPLPTSDPGVSGALWNSGGTVKVSP
jgi:hypothetical protein